MIDFSNTYVHVVRKGELCAYELADGKYVTFSELIPFEDLPQEIQERVAILLTAPEDTVIKGVGWRGDNDFILRNYE